MADAPALDQHGNPILNDEDDDDWFANNPAPSAQSAQSTSSSPSYTLPPGVTQAMADDFLARNPGDTHRLASAWVGDNQGGPYDRQGPAYNQATNQLNPGYGARAAAFNGPGGGGGGDAWGSMPSDFGGVPAPFGETYSTLDRPSWLQGEYVAPQWTESFQLPSMADLQQDPGYQTRLATAQKGFERSAAAKGSILSGGSQVALGREQQNLAANEYSAATGRAFDQYQQRYGQFMNNANLGSQARGVNEGAYQTDSGNNLSQYATRFSAYQTALGNKRQAEVDLWGRTQDQIRNSLTAAGLARP